MPACKLQSHALTALKTYFLSVADSIDIFTLHMWSQTEPFLLLDYLLLVIALFRL